MRCEHVLFHDQTESAALCLLDLVFTLSAMTCIKTTELKVFMQRNFNPKFYGLSVKLTQNGLVTSFTEVHHFASFVRNLALNNMQISYL